MPNTQIVSLTEYRRISWVDFQAVLTNGKDTLTSIVFQVIDNMNNMKDDALFTRYKNTIIVTFLRENQIVFRKDPAGVFSSGISETTGFKVALSRSVRKSGGHMLTDLDSETFQANWLEWRNLRYNK